MIKVAQSQPRFLSSHHQEPPALVNASPLADTDLSPLILSEMAVSVSYEAHINTRKNAPLVELVC